MDAKDQSEQAPVSEALQRSTSQLSSTSTKSTRGQTARGRAKARKLASQPSSSASSIAPSDKSLTSFPSFSPKQERYEHRPFDSDNSAEAVQTAKKPSVLDSSPSNRSTGSTVETLTLRDASNGARSALFEDTPIATRRIPGALHLADDDHIERLVAKHGAAHLVRQIAEDLAQRDSQIAALRRRTDARERALRKIIQQCGLSSLEIEVKLRTIEGDLRAQDDAWQAQGGGLSGLMNDAMGNYISQSGLGFPSGNDGTVRAKGPFTPTKGDDAGRSTLKGWKDYIWGTGTTKKTGRVSSAGGNPPKTTIRAPTQGERRPALQQDLFTPPDAVSVRSSSVASSTHSKNESRKPSTSLASKALQLVAGKAPMRETDTTRGRAHSNGYEDQMRASSVASNKTANSTRAVSMRSGPKALMQMRRAASQAPGPNRSSVAERLEEDDSSTHGPTSGTTDNYGPVEMDTIFSPEGQPPTLTHIYNNYHGSEYLTDRFGFIYDNRRKKRQREAAQVAARVKRGSRAAEMLSGARAGLPPTLVEDERSIRTFGSDELPGTPGSNEEIIDTKPKRWQDYLTIVNLSTATELLSHTPLIPASNIQVLEPSETPPPKSPGIITAEDRGFVPSASTTSALGTDPVIKSDDEPPAATLVHEDAEPVKLLLNQLRDVHDAQQREKSVRWNEFLRKVRAERRREGEAAAAAAQAAAEARFQQAPVMIPEAKLTDGETIGVADLGVKGKVGRAKWNEFRNLVLGGIPVANRPKIWAECSGALFKRIPGYYENLLSKSTENDDPSVVHQIDMDINRTLTDNIFFKKGPGVSKLSDVLRAYARRNPEVGYCQGMNLITANLLLIMPSTEDVFWILVSIVEQILPRGYYDHSLIASRADQVVLRQFVTQVLPKLSQHLDELSIELEALTFQWFLSVFTDCLSAEALFRVWDVVLCTNDGSTFLFQVALALLKLNEQQLLQCDTPAAIYTYINHQMTNHAISIDGLIQASEGLRKLVRREEVEERRSRAIEEEKRLMKEREELNQIRRAQKGASAPALVSEATASADPSPAPSPALDRDSKPASFPNLKVIGLEDDEEGMRSVRVSTPAEEEAAFGLG